MRERISGHVLMRVVNPRAPRADDVGHVVSVEGSPETPLERDVFVLEFSDGERQRYNIVELEVVMP